MAWRTWLRLGLAGWFAWSGPAAASILELHARIAGSDVARIQADVNELATLSENHIRAVGLHAALRDFMAPPWSRRSNGLHLWCITINGTSWFDAGHPDLVGLEVAGMADLEGRIWPDLALASAKGSGPAMFELLYPHPGSGQAARSFHRCFMLEDGLRLLCAGAFQDF